MKTDDKAVIEIPLQTISEDDIPDSVAEEYAGKKFGKGHKGRPPAVVGRKVARMNQDKLRKKRNGTIVKLSPFDRFMEEYERNGGNGTQAIITLTGNPSRINASAMASYYLGHAKDIGRMVLEKKGITLEKMLELAWQKAQVSKDTAYWDRLMKFLGEDFLNKQVATTSVSVNINKTQKEVRDEFGFGQAVEGETLSEDGKTI